MNAQQLRNSILQEAIEGRLVPQDPNDEPASALLERIREEKRRLVKEGKLKKKDLVETPISEDEKPFEIPEGWEWVRWGMLGEYKKGPFGSSLTKSMFVPKSDEAVKVYEQKNAIQKDYTLGDYYISREKYETMKGFTVHPGDIIVSCAGTIGETYLLPLDAPIGIINQALMRAKLFLDSIIPYWLLHFSYILLIENKLKGKGSAIKNIPPFEVLKAMPVPLPPLAEQHRIVERIEELMPKVEEYGKAQEALDKLNAELPEKLKKSILQEAIEGRLVPQDTNDEPASVLLDKIRKEKAQLVKEGKLKKKDLVETPISEDEIPFEIPESWEWCRLGSVIDLLSGRDLTPQDYNSKEEGIPYITGASNFEKGSLLINRWTPKPITISKLGDLLITCKGTIGTMAFNDFGDIHIARQVMAISPYIIDIKYIKYFLMRIVYELDKKAKSIIPGISREDLLTALFPLPPLAEQHRIVERIEKLMGGIEML